MTVKEAPLRVAIYSRISEDTEGEERGVRRQEADCYQRAEREGWTVVRLYRENDIGASTRSRKPRPKFAAMLEAARSGEFDAILAYSNSRLTRRPLELENLITLHARHGTRLRTIVSGDDDLSTADGCLMARLKADIDAAEAERTGERVKRKQAANRAIGLAGTKRAFGWTSDYVEGPSGKPQRIGDREQPDEFPALQTGLQMILRAESIAAVARYWNSLGLTTVAQASRKAPGVSGKPWTSTRTRDVLMRWRNAGVQQHNGQPVYGTKATWSAACTVDELLQIRATIGKNSKSLPTGAPLKALLSHAAYCGKCGRPLIGGKQRSARKTDPDGWAMVYRCSGAQSLNGDKCFLTIRRDFLEPLVIRAMREVLFFSHVADLTPTKAETEHVAALTSERVQIVEEERQIGELMGARRMSITAATAALDGLSERRAAIDVEVTAVTSRYALRALFEGGGEIGLKRAVNIAREFQTLEVTQQREIVRGLFNVVVQPGRNPQERVEITRRSDGSRMANAWEDVANDEILSA